MALNIPEYVFDEDVEMEDENNGSAKTKRREKRNRNRLLEQTYLNQEAAMKGLLITHLQQTMHWKRIICD